jgi:hypothetical protein
MLFPSVIYVQLSSVIVSPVSVFDQQLEEDPRVNRLDDSIILWAAICTSRLLARTQLILFLNKCDLLRRKLKRGIKIKEYHPSYGDRPNDVTAVVKCLFVQYSCVLLGTPVADVAAQIIAKNLRLS